MKQTTYGVLLYVLLIIPPVTHFLESIMVLHMLVQLPLLMLAGWLMGKRIIKKYDGFFQQWNSNGIPGILFVFIITMYWMVPRAMDETLILWYVELFKFISLPLVGLAFRDSWDKLQILGKTFVFLNYLPMFGLMAWLYIDSPIQICNNYLEIEQQTLGWGFVVITTVMVLYFIQIVFIDHSEKS